MRKKREPIDVHSLRFGSEKLSYPLLIGFITLEIFIIASAFFAEQKHFYIVSAIGLLLLYSMVFSCRVAVDRGSLYIRFGMGVISKEYDLHAVERFEITKNKSVFAWLYNPLGESALGVRLRDGRILNLPVSDPKMLQEIMRLQF